MTTFNVGDKITSNIWPEHGKGEILNISGNTLWVRFEDYQDYDDEDPDNMDEPYYLDFHYVDIKHARLVEEVYKYNPEQAGDTDEDI